MITNEDVDEDALSCIKKISVLLRGITSKDNCDFYCLNCLNKFRMKIQLEWYKLVCENKVFRNLTMSLKTLKYLNLINIKNLINHHLLSMPCSVRFFNVYNIFI